MDKKKTKNKNHNKKKHSASNQLAKFRGWIQAGATLLTNIHLPNFFKGEIYQGKGKAVCVPGLNCYSCPAASGACPIGSFQAVVGSSKYKFSYYITGFLILLGVLLGRFICGFLCPFGWLQDLLHKVPTKKFSTKKLKPLTYIKYAVLLLAVVLLPVLIVNDLGMGDPYFCKYICPQGVLEGALPLSAVNEGIRSALGKLFSWKLVVLISVVVLSVLFYRPFCKWICPLGAFYALFNKVYIIFTVEQVIQYMNCGRDKAMKTLAELDTKKGIGLIERVKQGFGKPDIIYVKNFILRTSKDVKNNDESEESIQQNREVEEVDLSESEKSTYRGRKNRLQGVGKTDFKRSENTTYRGRKIRTTEVGKIDPINTKYNYTDISNTDRNNTDLINLSDSSEQQSMDLMEEMELFQMNTALVKRNIEYDCLVQRCRLGEQQQLDEIVALIVETISIERENITISGVKYPYQFVKSRLLLLEESHIEYVLDCLHENTREVKNIKAYLLTCLMNSITTIGNYYQAKVNHDMYGGGI